MTGELLDYKRHDFLVDNNFNKLVSLRQELSSRKKEVETQLKGINEEISGLMATLDEAAVLCNGFKVTLTEGMRKSLKKELLLSLNVSVDIINQATIETPFTTLRVSEVK